MIARQSAYYISSVIWRKKSDKSGYRAQVRVLQPEFGTDGRDQADQNLIADSDDPVIREGSFAIEALMTPCCHF